MIKDLLNSILFRASLVVMGLLFAGAIFGQTIILSAQTEFASNIPAGNMVNIEAGGTLIMDVSRTFNSVATVNSGVSFISGSGALTISTFLTVNGTNTVSTATSITASVFMVANQAGQISTVTGTGNINVGTIEINGVNAAATTLLIAAGSNVQTGNINGGFGNGATTYNLAVSGTLKISGVIETGTTGLENFTCNNGSTVEYNGAAQNVYPTDYYHLVLSGGGAKTLQAATNIIGGNLTLSGTAVSANASDMTVAGSVTIGNGTAASVFTLTNNHDLTVTGNTIINANSTLTTTGNNDLILKGDLVNNGTFKANITGVNDMNVLFNGAVNQTVSGTGVITDFNDITINNTGAAGNDQVEITSSSFTVSDGFLILTNGVFKVSGSFTLTNTFFNNNNYTIPAVAGFWLNNTNVTVTGQNADVTLNGSLRITAGTFNVGDNVNLDLRHGNAAVLTVDGGILNIAGALSGTSATSAQTLQFNMSAGTMNLAVSGNSSNDRSSFDMRMAGSSFTMSGGTIIIKEANTGDEGDYRNIAGTINITGGTVQFGNASTGIGTEDNFILRGTGTNVLPGLSIVGNASSVPSVTLTTPITVRGNVTINAGTSLLAGTHAISITGNTAPGTSPGNFTNNGTFTTGTQTTTFNGTALQTIGGTVATTFNSITFNNGAGFTLATNNSAIGGLATFTNGIITPNPSTNVLIFNDNAISSLTAANAATTSYVNGAVRKVGNDVFTFPIGGATGFVPLAISNPDNTADAYTAQYFRGIPVERNNITAAGIDHISGCDYWDLALTFEAGTTATISATLYWNANNPCNGANNYVTDFATVRAVHYTGGSWSAASAGFGSGTNAAGSVIFAGLTTFSPFALGSTSAITNPLPVVFANEKAYEKNSGVQIEWSNLTEKDVAEYTIERSANGRDFSAIGQQLPTSNQNDKADYSAFDASPIAVINYYRIKAVETTGKIVYSRVLNVNLGITNQRMKLCPNPVSGKKVTLGLSDVKPGQYNLRVINMAGQDVFKQTINSQGSSLSQALDLPSIVKPGVYSMVITGDGYRESKMFIVQ